MLVVSSLLTQCMYERDLEEPPLRSNEFSKILSVQAAARSGVKRARFYGFCRCRLWIFLPRLPEATFGLQQEYPQVTRAWIDDAERNCFVYHWYYTVLCACSHSDPIPKKPIVAQRLGRPALVDLLASLAANRCLPRARHGGLVGPSCESSTLQPFPCPLACSSASV